MNSHSHMPLGKNEFERIESARNWIKRHWVDKPNDHYASLDGKLHVIRTILKNERLDRHETWKLQALGIAFGDALAQKLMLEWVTIVDEYGCDPALIWPGTSINCFPLTMISKHIERGEDLDVQCLFDSTCSKLTEMAFSGGYI